MPPDLTEQVSPVAVATEDTILRAFSLVRCCELVAVRALIA